MRKLFLPFFVVSCLFLAGCFQAQVTTDRQPGQTVEKKWATGFINGLAMTDSQVDAAQECPNGVARVETELSFANQLVGGLTLGIYSPMTVRVTCAAGGSMTSGLMDAPDLEVSQDAPAYELEETVTAAAYQSAQTEEPVHVHFTE